MSQLMYTVRTLDNGLRVIISPCTRLPEVSVQLWYGVGSRHEGTGEKGIAHFIEHMIFKGTTSLSESAIDYITHTLSGSTNAFTSYDYTGYMFDLPSGHWQHCLPIMADCMTNCTFVRHCMNSEVKAVVQELKMYRDDYTSTLFERMVGALFYDHPYHHPVIGYKQDLLQLERDRLISFYKRFYGPRNATLVIVGDVDVEFAWQQAVCAFGSIPSGHVEPTSPAQLMLGDTDIMRQDIALYRDIEQPILLFAWKIPGVKALLDAQFDLASWIIGSGKGSLLYRRLVDEMDIAQDVSCFVYDLFDHSVFFIQVSVYSIDDAERIEAEIMAILQSMVHEPVSPAMVERAVRKTKSDFVDLLQNNQKKAYILGKYATALGDPSYLNTYLEVDKTSYASWLANFVQQYLRPSLMIRGAVRPLDAADRQLWTEFQERSDADDQMIMARLERTEPVAEPACTFMPEKKPLPTLRVPSCQKVTLPNGLTILFHDDPTFPKTDIVFDFQGKYFYDPEEQQGLLVTLFDLLQEGCAGKSAQEVAQEIEARGMDLVTFPGMVAMSCLTEDTQQAITTLSDIVQRATLSESALQRVKARLLVDVKDFWDTPSEFIGQMVREAVYGAHPYHKNIYGTVDTLQSVTHHDILAAYQQYVVPGGTRVAIVGNLSGLDIPELMQQYFGNWQGQAPERIRFPELAPVTARKIVKKVNRDQVVLAYAGASVRRTDPDYDGLLLFDQIFTGGVLGSMGSRLFALRQQSGMFYTIGGSLVASCDEQPGLLYIKTIVSVDSLATADTLIREQIAHAIDTLTETELHDARNAIAHALIQHLVTPRKIASTLLFMDTFGLTEQFFLQRFASLNQWTVERVQKTVRKYLALDRLVEIAVGRVL